ncbi:MAG: cell division protein [Pseudomonadota bacterium]
MTVFNQFSGSSKNDTSLVYSQFMEQVKDGKIAKVEIDNHKIKGTTSEGKKFNTYAPTDPWLVSDLLKNNVIVEAKPEEQQSILMSIFISWFPMILLVGVWIFFMRQMQGGSKGGGPFSFGKSKARQLDQTNNQTTFADVAGCDEAKEEVTEIVEFLKDPGKFHKLGGRIPRGVLMVGPPGTGKTLLARAIAGEAKVPFFTISGSDFVEMFVGVGAARVRDMFEQAKKSAPCIIFIDEIDAIGGSRFSEGTSADREIQRTLMELLNQMDGFEDQGQVKMVMATNRPDILDPALLRPGRLDRKIEIPEPNETQRLEILKIHSASITKRGDIDFESVVKLADGLNGADMRNICTEAGLFAIRNDRDYVLEEDFMKAARKILDNKKLESKLDYSKV